MKMVTILLTSILILGSGCRCSDAGPSESELDNAGMLRTYPIHYELHVERNAATVTVNEQQEIVLCDMFSEHCDVGELGDSPPRLRHHLEEAELTPYLKGGSNHVEVVRRPDGEDEDPVEFSLIRTEDGKLNQTLAEGVIPVGSDSASFTVEVPGGCEHPALPDVDWVARFLDPHPEAATTRRASAYVKLLPPARTDDEVAEREYRLAASRKLSLNDYPFPRSAIRQTHHSAPLALNYSCENERLFVHPADGGYLFAAVQIERHPDGPITGAEISTILTTAIALGQWNGQWYYGEAL